MWYWHSRTGYGGGGDGSYHCAEHDYSRCERGMHAEREVGMFVAETR